MLAIPSDEPPRPASRAGLGHQFRYWRGASGRRYLFSAVSPESLADFRFAVVIFAEPTGDGRLTARALLRVSAEPVTERPAAGQVALVHFISATDAERRRLVEDLTGGRLSLAA